MGYLFLCNDFVEVTYEDFSETFCGDTVPEAITSSGSSMVVKFHSDGSKAGAGFRAVWEELPPCGSCETANCLTYPADYPCSQYPNNIDKVT